MLVERAGIYPMGRIRPVGSKLGICTSYGAFCKLKCARDLAAICGNCLFFQGNSRIHLANMGEKGYPVGKMIGW